MRKIRCNFLFIRNNYYRNFKESTFPSHEKLFIKSLNTKQNVSINPISELKSRELINNMTR